MESSGDIILRVPQHLFVLYWSWYDSEVDRRLALRNVVDVFGHDTLARIKVLFGGCPVQAFPGLTDVSTHFHNNEIGWKLGAGEDSMYIQGWSCDLEISKVLLPTFCPCCVFFLFFFPWCTCLRFLFVKQSSVNKMYKGNVQQVNPEANCQAQSFWFKILQCHADFSLFVSAIGKITG